MNPTDTHNLPFSDHLQGKINDITRFLYQNTGSLELSTDTYKLETKCESMYTLGVDMECFVEINTHWCHKKTKRRLLKVKRQFWKRTKIQTSESAIPWNSIHKPGGSLTIPIPNISLSFIGTEEDLDGMG